LANNFKSTFLSCEIDQETIWRRLFVESRPYSDKLKRLLVINTPDCLDESQVQYQEIIDGLTLQEMKDLQYIKNIPKLSFGEHEEVKSYVLLEFDNFIPTENPYYRNCTISFTIVSHLDYWELDDYKLRPYQIAGYIDGLLNQTKLSGIGTIQFMGAEEIIFNEYLGGLQLSYLATHGYDDVEKLDESLPSGPTDLGFGA
jgi:hypothetical protein